jgi:hypothetical protein
MMKVLREVNLYEYGPVLYPANPHTKILVVREEEDDDTGDR